MKYIRYVDTPVGKIRLVEENEKLTELTFHANPSEKLQGIKKENTPLLEETYQQLMQYFQGTRREFDLPLDLKGTNFQEKVWKALQTIPYGEARSYKEIAQQIGNPKAVRAVGGANHNNAISIIVPCHRVIHHNQTIGGYGGDLEIKYYLLELEGYKLLK